MSKDRSEYKIGAMDYLSSVLKQFQYYKSLGEKSMDQLRDDQLFEYERGTNSIAIIVNHLHGNMMSRWTDFLNSDGEKTWRNRDQEFEGRIKNKEELLRKWNEGWQCLFDALDSINEENFGTIVYIRNHGHTIIEAINRQLCHYSYHVGQMVHIAKVFKGDHWNSLSIPKGKSTEYNKEKFSKEKSRTHFTDDL